MSQIILVAGKVSDEQVEATKQQHIEPDYPGAEVVRLTAAEWMMFGLDTVLETINNPAMSHGTAHVISTGFFPIADGSKFLFDASPLNGPDNGTNFYMDGAIASVVNTYFKTKALSVCAVFQHEDVNDSDCSAIWLRHLPSSALKCSFRAEGMMTIGTH